MGGLGWRECEEGIEWEFGLGIMMKKVFLKKTSCLIVGTGKHVQS